MNTYPIVKQTATHADALAAMGAADVLRHLEPRILEFEDRFEVRLPRQLVRSDIDTIDPGFSYLLRPGKEAPEVPAERIMELRNGKPEEDGLCAARSTENDRTYLILSRMKAYAGPNKVVSEFANMPRAEWTERVWDCLNGGCKFTRPTALVQLFNPQSARGYALLKPSCTDRGDRTKDSWAEPFVEWLRFRGYFEGSAGWFTGGDLRLYCPIPADVPYDELAAT